MNLMAGSSKAIQPIPKEDWARLLDKVYGATDKLESTLQGHAKETREALASLDRSVAVTTFKIEGVSEVVKPIPAQIARLETHVDTLHEGDRYHRLQMTTVREQVTDLEIRVASGTKTFWESSNFKYVLILTATLITGLLAIAGYQIKI